MWALALADCSVRGLSGSGCGCPQYLRNLLLGLVVGTHSFSGTWLLELTCSLSQPLRPQVLASAGHTLSRLFCSSPTPQHTSLPPQYTALNGPEGTMLPLCAFRQAERLIQLWVLKICCLAALGFPVALHSAALAQLKFIKGAS